MEVFSNANNVYFFLLIFLCMSLDCKLVPVQNREYKYDLLFICWSMLPKTSIAERSCPLMRWCEYFVVHKKIYVAQNTFRLIAHTLIVNNYLFSGKLLAAGLSCYGR